MRLGLRMLTVDPSSIPDDVITLHADLIRDLRADPQAPVAFLEAARSINTYVRSRSLGARAMSNVRCPVLVIHGRKDRFVPVGNALVALADLPGVARPSAGRRGPRATDGGARSLADRGRRLVRGFHALIPC